MKGYELSYGTGTTISLLFLEEMYNVLFSTSNYARAVTYEFTPHDLMPLDVVPFMMIFTDVISFRTLQTFLYPV